MRWLSGLALSRSGREAASLGHAQQRGISTEPLMRDAFAHLPNPACGSADHTLHRRKFLQGLAGAGAGPLSLMSWGGLFSLPALARQDKRERNHCILLWPFVWARHVITLDPQPGHPTRG